MNNNLINTDIIKVIPIDPNTPGLEVTLSSKKRTMYLSIDFNNNVHVPQGEADRKINEARIQLQAVLQDEINVRGRELIWKKGANTSKTVLTDSLFKLRLSGKDYTPLTKDLQVLTLRKGHAFGLSPITSPLRLTNDKVIEVLDRIQSVGLSKRYEEVQKKGQQTEKRDMNLENKSVSLVNEKEAAEAQGVNLQGNQAEAPKNWFLGLIGRIGSFIKGVFCKIADFFKSFFKKNEIKEEKSSLPGQIDQDNPSAEENVPPEGENDKNDWGDTFVKH